MLFPAEKTPVARNAPPDFPLRKDGILHPPSGCLGAPLPLTHSLYGRTRTLKSEPKFFGSTGYQICLPMVLRELR